MSQAVTDWALRKAGALFGKPTREGFSVTTQADGTVWAWFHQKF